MNYVGGNIMDLKKHIANIQDYPVEGILFRDITPLMQNGEAFQKVCEEMAAFAKKVGADIIVGPESRGFIFGCPVAYQLGIGFIPVRKPNKLPRETVSYEYDLEYGSNVLHMHKDAIKPNQKVLIIDDLLATGGTVDASIRMIEELQGEVVGCCFLIELMDLKGRELLSSYPIRSLIQYD